MPRDATATRERILDAAHSHILGKGFAGTSIENILEGAGISRGTFFYHFSTKDEMARALIRRYADEDRQTAEDHMARAEGLARDPLQQILIFFGLYIEMLEGLEDTAPGCLFASYSYEASLFGAETHDIIAEGVEHWRSLVGGKLDEAIQLHPPRIPVTGATLADLAFGIFEGAFIMARVAKSPEPMPEHFRQFRNYLELLFGVADPGK